MPRVGNKRADRRWEDEHGNIWASRFEYLVYRAYKDAGFEVRKCDERDTVVYAEPKRGHNCLDCGSDAVVQKRRYTPDLRVTDPQNGEQQAGSYCVEAKGYFPASKRALFRTVVKQCPDLNVRLVFERNARAPKSKLTYLEYSKRYFKGVPAVAGLAQLKEEWL